MPPVGVCKEGRSSSMAIGLSKKCKSLLNKACTVPWCHAVVQFEVKMSRFPAAIPEKCLDRGSTPTKQAVFPPRRFPMRYTRLGPNSVLL